MRPAWILIFGSIFSVENTFNLVVTNLSSDGLILTPLVITEPGFQVGLVNVGSSGWLSVSSQQT